MKRTIAIATLGLVVLVLIGLAISLARLGPASGPPADRQRDEPAGGARER